jgi:hypothetical protein
MRVSWQASGVALILSASFALSVPVHAAELRAAEPTFIVPDAQLPDPLILVTTGDNGFSAQPAKAVDTAASTNAGSPNLANIRRALVAGIADQHAAAIFLTGDLAVQGRSADYADYAEETESWRNTTRVYPALGDQEFSACAEAQCLERWWTAFPTLRGHRWYSVKLGSQVLAIVLDSNSSLLPGSRQRAWLEEQLAGSAADVRFALVVLHHPPLADQQTRKPSDDQPRANERALVDYLGSIPTGDRPPMLVVSGHINNYERFSRGGIDYVVTGGGGEKTEAIERTDEDLYDRRDYPNYHYLRLTVRDKKLIGEMIRLGDAPHGSSPVWDTLDRFRLTARH